jgi:hypothetical protein
MKPINAVCLSGFLLTAIVLYFLNLVPFIPAWAVFITWACFFHMEGGLYKEQTYFSIIRHIGLGAFAAWLTALLLLLQNPFSHATLAAWWGPVLIAAVIASLMRLGTFSKFSVTPAVIYGYAMIWAFLSLPGSFDIATLTSLSFDNALIVIGICLLLGASAAYLNALMVDALCGLKSKEQ